MPLSFAVVIIELLHHSQSVYDPHKLWTFYGVLIIVVVVIIIIDIVHKVQHENKRSNRQTDMKITQ